MKVVLIGGGELARQIAYYINNYDKQVELVGFVDDYASIGEERFGVSCLGPVVQVKELYTQGMLDAVIIGIGYKHLIVRKKLFNALYEDIPFYTFIHPTAFIDSSAIIGKGCCIGPRVVIEQHANVDNNVFLYANVNISHDSKIGPHSFIAPSVNIAGFVNIGCCCFIGINSTLIERVHVADNVVLGAASLVLQNLHESGLYVGSPARLKKR